MNFRFGFFAICFLAVTELGAQTLRLLDKSDLNPIADALVYSASTNKNVISNSKGKVDLGYFERGDLLIIQHPSYYEIQFRHFGAADTTIYLAEKMLQLDELVFSVARIGQKRDNTPNEVAVVSSKDITFNNPPTTADALISSGKVFIQKSQLGGGSPMLRGYAANRILLAVDNVRMNNAIYRSGNLQNIINLDVNSMAQMEVLFGPGSVVYGSDAIGGVIHMYTKNPSLNTTNAVNVQGNAMLRYGSAANELSAGLTLEVANHKLGSLTSFSYSDFDDLRMGSRKNDDYQRWHYVAREGEKDLMVLNDDPNVQKFSGYRQYNILQKMLWQPTNKFNIDLNFQYSTTSDIPRYDRLLEYEGDTLRYAEWNYGPQDWMQLAVGFNYVAPTKLFDELKVKLAFQNIEESRITRGFGDDRRSKRVEGVKALLINADFVRNLDDFSRLQYGLNLSLNSVSSTGTYTNIVVGDNQPAPSRYPDGSKLNSYAGYVSYEYDRNKKIIYKAGLRFSVYDLNATIDTAFYNFDFTSLTLLNSAFNGGVGLVWNINPNSRFKVNLSSGFRSPNIDDVAKVFDSEPGNVVVPNPDLKPEFSYNFDLGFRQRVGDVFEVDFTLFASYLDQAMVRRDYQVNGKDSIVYDGELSRVQALVNTGNATIYGFSTGVVWSVMPYLDLRGTFNYIKGNDDEGLPLRHVTPIFGRANAELHFNKFKFDLSVDYSGEISYANLAPSERNKSHIYAADREGNPYSPSWTALNIKASYQFSRNIGLNFGIENILNVRYRPYSSGIVAPGRNFLVSLSGRF